MKLTLELAGEQTDTHCSATSSIGACDKLNLHSHRCLLFKIRVNYDWDAHAYKRCDQCIASQNKEENV